MMRDAGGNDNSVRTEDAEVSPPASLIFADSSVAWRVYSIVCAAEKWAADGGENSHGTTLASLVSC